MGGKDLTGGVRPGRWSEGTPLVPALWLLLQSSGPLSGVGENMARALGSSQLSLQTCDDEAAPSSLGGLLSLGKAMGLPPTQCYQGVPPTPAPPTLAKNTGLAQLGPGLSPASPWPEPGLTPAWLFLADVPGSHTGSTSSPAPGQSLPQLLTSSPASGHSCSLDAGDL